MKMGLQNYVVIIQIDKSYIKFNNNKTNSSQRYDTAQNYRIVYKTVHSLSQHNLKMSITPPYTKSPSNKIIILIKLVHMSTVFQCTELHTRKCNGP
jgi:hypothetical protein